MLAKMPLPNIKFFYLTGLIKKEVLGIQKFNLNFMGRRRQEERNVNIFI